MKNKLIFGLFIFLMLGSLIVYADEGITKAVPVNIKIKCTAGFIGEQFCKKNNVYQIYQTDVCVKYNKLIKECISGEMCINGVCTRGNPENAITGAAVTEPNSAEPKEGFFARIINWFKSLF